MRRAMARLPVMVAGLCVVLLSGCSTPEEGMAPTQPETQNARATAVKPELVAVESREVLFCAFCGRVIKERRKHVRVPVGEVSKQSTVRRYGLCGAKRCQKAAALRRKHPDWSQDVCYCIAGRLVRLGMTKDQARAAWGAPRDVNRTTTAFGVSEQWCYGEFGGSYLYFEDGILTSIQN